MNWITLEGGAQIYFNGMKGQCKSCDANFLWGITKNDKWIPVAKDESGKHISHFANCPGAGKHRK